MSKRPRDAERIRPSCKRSSRKLRRKRRLTRVISLTVWPDNGHRHGNVMSSLTGFLSEMTRTRKKSYSCGPGPIQTFSKNDYRHRGFFYIGSAAILAALALRAGSPHSQGACFIVLPSPSWPLALSPDGENPPRPFGPPLQGGDRRSGVVHRRSGVLRFAW